MGALEAALADLAVDLDAITGDTAPGEDDWRGYLAGDRAVFARRLAGAIDAQTVDRIAALYREDTRFRDAANIYMSEFEALLARARRRRRRAADADDPLRRHRQDLSRDRLFAGTAVTHTPCVQGRALRKRAA
jgi:hypothetical protein